MKSSNKAQFFLTHTMAPLCISNLLSTTGEYRTALCQNRILFWITPYSMSFNALSLRCCLKALHFPLHFLLTLCALCSRYPFLVACTRLYKSLCLSVGRLVGRLVGRSHIYFFAFLCIFNTGKHDIR